MSADYHLVIPENKRILALWKASWLSPLTHGAHLYRTAEEIEALWEADDCCNAWWQVQRAAAWVREHGGRAIVSNEWDVATDPPWASDPGCDRAFEWSMVPTQRMCPGSPWVVDEIGDYPGDLPLEEREARRPDSLSSQVGAISYTPGSRHTPTIMQDLAAFGEENRARINRRGF